MRLLHDFMTPYCVAQVIVSHSVDISPADAPAALRNMPHESDSVRMPGGKRSQACSMVARVYSSVIMRH